MSGTTTVKTDTVSTTSTPPLISNSPANQSTAAASSAGAAAIVIILLWILGLFHVTVPPEVSAAFVTLVGMAVHFVVIKYGLDTTP